MSLRKSLTEKGVPNSQIAFVAQGFVDLLADQLSLSAKMATLAQQDMLCGRTKAASEKVLQIEKTMKHVVLSQEMALLLIKTDGRS